MQAIAVVLSDLSRQDDFGTGHSSLSQLRRLPVQDALREMGCDSAQGWHLSRPQPAESMTTWLLARAACERDALSAG